jgi:hypothetical protein
VSGARIDVGAEARIALVKAALGLDGAAIQEEKGINPKTTAELLDNQSDSESHSEDELHTADELHAEVDDSDSVEEVKSDPEIDPDDKANPV